MGPQSVWLEHPAAAAVVAGTATGSSSSSTNNSSSSIKINNTITSSHDHLTSPHIHTYIWGGGYCMDLYNSLLHGKYIHTYMRKHTHTHTYPQRVQFMFNNTTPVELLHTHAYTCCTHTYTRIYILYMRYPQTFNTVVIILWHNNPLPTHHPPQAQAQAASTNPTTSTSKSISTSTHNRKPTKTSTHLPGIIIPEQPVILI